jgi:hypothetical protein
MCDDGSDPVVCRRFLTGWGVPVFLGFSRLALKATAHCRW